MSLDPSVEILDEGPDDVETVVISWLRPLLPNGQIANGRLPDDPLPFIGVNHLTGEECVEESYVDELVSVHVLADRGLGNSGNLACASLMSGVHRRMLLLARYLEPVVVDGRPADIEYVDVHMRPRWEPYGDEQILRKLARYRVGLAYAKLS